MKKLFLSVLLAALFAFTCAACAVDDTGDTDGDLMTIEVSHTPG